LQGEVDLDLAIASLGLLDETPDRRLVGHLPDRHRPAHLDDVEQGLTAGLDLGLGRAGPSFS